MSKIIVALSAVAVAAEANPYLDVDGHFNLTKIQALNEKVDKAVAKFVAANTDQKPPKPDAVYVIPRKAKPVKYSKTLEAKKDLKYMTSRAIKVTVVKRVTEAGTIRNLPILSSYDKSVIGALAPEVKTAISALTKHHNKSLKTKEAVTKIRTKVREEGDAALDQAVALLKTALGDKIGENDLIESKGMMGRSILLKIGKDSVVTIGKSDIARFRAAVKAAKESETAE